MSIPGLIAGPQKAAGLFPQLSGGGAKSVAGGGFPALLQAAGLRQVIGAPGADAGAPVSAALTQVRVLALQPDGSLEPVSYQLPFQDVAIANGAIGGLSQVSGTPYTESNEPELPSLETLAVAQAIEDGRGIAILYPEEREEVNDEIAQLLEALERRKQQEQSPIVEIILGLDGQPLEVRRIEGPVIANSLPGGSASGEAPLLPAGAAGRPEQAQIPAGPASAPSLSAPDAAGDITGGVADFAIPSGAAEKPLLGETGALAAEAAGIPIAPDAAGKALKVDADDAGDEVTQLPSAAPLVQQTAGSGVEAATTEDVKSAATASQPAQVPVSQKDEVIGDPVEAQERQTTEGPATIAQSGSAEDAKAEDGEPSTRAAAPNQTTSSQPQPVLRPVSSLVDPALQDEGADYASLEAEGDQVDGAPESGGDKERGKGSDARNDNAPSTHDRRLGVSQAALAFAETVRGVGRGDVRDENGDPLTPSDLFRIQPQTSDGIAARQPSQSAQQLPQAAQVAPQIALHIARHVSQGSNRFQIRLDPPELGRVDVELKITSDGVVKAHLTVERSETLDLFLRDQRGLERALDAAGLKVEQDALQFSLKDQGNSPSFADHHERDEGGKGNNGGGIARSEVGPDEADRDLRRVYVRGAAGALDIQV
ncbi:flagellar hook-length control protein FliK [Stappia sp. F7233]|uniref:Flagellar hook-length control protein FliK n=1 Tax=Stappia albiluteola TaxID=2758565 RepID=A0A839A916_9HYPH|nr:flagellar hook-length control protein FliK [Stappia albiluteola]MBA5775706.1 flagellar hook-length control protein FliK [Stappia albiluteola]